MSTAISGNLMVFRLRTMRKTSAMKTSTYRLTAVSIGGGICLQNWILMNRTSLRYLLLKTVNN